MQNETWLEKISLEAVGSVWKRSEHSENIGRVSVFGILVTYLMKYLWDPKVLARTVWNFRLFQKAVMACLVFKTTSENSCSNIQALVKNGLISFGWLVNIHIDWGTNFKSGFFRELYQILEIRKTSTTSSLSEGNAMMGRTNRRQERYISQ